MNFEELSQIVQPTDSELIELQEGERLDAIALLLSDFANAKAKRDSIDFEMRAIREQIEELAEQCQIKTLNTPRAKLSFSASYIRESYDSKKIAAWVIGQSMKVQRAIAMFKKESVVKAQWKISVKKLED